MSRSEIKNKEERGKELRIRRDIYEPRNKDEEEKSRF